MSILTGSITFAKKIKNYIDSKVNNKVSYLTIDTPLDFEVTTTTHSGLVENVNSSNDHLTEIKFEVTNISTEKVYYISKMLTKDQLDKQLYFLIPGIDENEPFYLVFFQTKLSTDESFSMWARVDNAFTLATMKIKGITQHCFVK